MRGEGHIGPAGVVLPRFVVAVKLQRQVVRPAVVVLPGGIDSTVYTCSERLECRKGWKRSVSLSWILLGLVGWAFGLVVVLAIFRMAGDQDRAARHEQKRLDPYSDVTITRTGDA
jgi:hypothetical protein